MSLKKIKIENFKIFENFTLELNAGVNILVGDNDVGKSTILEAIHLALTGMINGKYLNTELTQYLFNNRSVEKYISSIERGDPEAPPQIKIELFFDESCGMHEWMGGINSEHDVDAYGIALIISLNEKLNEYSEFIKNGNLKTLPIEFYDAKWMTFADATLTTRNIPLKSALVDSSLARYQNGSDVYISRIVRQSLETAEAISIAQAHRKMRENFMEDAAVKSINEKIQSNATVGDKTISLSVEMLSKNAWESTLMTYVDRVPFHYIGKGEQCIIKTELALAEKKTQSASIILMEEPENHLTHAKLNQLLNVIESKCEGRQVIVSTHSNFVANKLGLENIVLLGRDGSQGRFSDMHPDTSSFFKTLPGYNTLRLVLSKSAILVEGPSDELVVQKAFQRMNDGKLPIFKGIDVISVGTAFLRFLEIAERIKACVSVVTDNDGDIASLENKYKNYIGDNKKETILISYDKKDNTPQSTPLEKYNYNTLENLMLRDNSLSTLNVIFGKDYKAEDELRRYMEKNKVECALKLFESTEKIVIPSYISEAIAYVTQ